MPATTTETTTETTTPDNAAAINPHGATGPRTDPGKIRSSQNALKTGLFAARDFICDGEYEEYNETLTSLLIELDPQGILEETFATEIMGAQWRLRRCRIIESTLATAPDALQIEKQQKSVDRARAHSHTILRRSIAELRKLQTERALRAQTDFPTITGLADTQQLLELKATQNRSPNAIPLKPIPPKPRPSKPADRYAALEAFMAMADEADGMNGTPTFPDLTSFCESTATPAPEAKMTPRNSLCPCGSGAKYKRCCGKDAPPVLNLAA